MNIPSTGLQRILNFYGTKLPKNNYNSKKSTLFSVDLWWTIQDSKMFREHCSIELSTYRPICRAGNIIQRVSADLSIALP